MSARLSRRAFLVLLTTPALAAGCNLTNSATPSPAVTSTVPATPAVASAATATTRPTTAPTPVISTRASAPLAIQPPAAADVPSDLSNARRGGRLVHGWLADVRTLNPLFATDDASRQATSLLFNGLVRINPSTLQPEPDLAERWQISPDGRSYTFTMRPSVTFHDGQPCTAEDVKFTYDLLLSERAYAPAQADLAGIIEQVTVVNPTTVEFRLKHVSAPFLIRHTGYGIVPKHRLASLDRARLEQSEFSLAQPIGTGPFHLKEWQREQALVLARHDAYFAGQPYLDEVVLKVVPSQDALHEQLKTGEIDIGAVREDSAGPISQEPNLLLSLIPTLSITYAGFQLDREQSPLFQDQRVRQALAYALDREALLRQARFGLGQVATGPIPPPLWPAGSPLANSLQHNPTRAAQLLDSAGWLQGPDGVRTRDGQPLAFELLTNRSTDGGQVHERYAQLMQAAWRAIGVEARLVVVDFAEVVHRLRQTHRFDMYVTTFAGDADPDQRLLWSTNAYTSGLNASKYSNTELDRLMTEAVRMNDQTQRLALYQRVQEMLLADLPAIILDYPAAAVGINRRVGNVTVSPISPGYHAHRWWAAAGS